MDGGLKIPLHEPILASVFLTDEPFSLRNEVTESIAAHRQQKQQQQTAPSPASAAAATAMVPQNAAPTTTPTLAGILGHLSPHAVLVGRMVLFWNRLNSAMTDSDAKEFRRWLIRMSDAQTAKISAIQSAYTALRAGPASEEAIAANRSSLGAEMYVLEKVGAFLDAVTGPDGGMAEAHFLWNDCLKYVLQKDTGELTVVYRDRVSQGMGMYYTNCGMPYQFGSG